MNPFVIISGCSGGGKSTLLAELERRGYTVFTEPGRRIIQEEVLTGGRAVPWVDMACFLHRAIEMSQDDYLKAPANSHKWVFFDRGLIDVSAALEALTGEAQLSVLSENYRYHPKVFLTPPWPEIYVQDTERRHDLDAARVEFERLQQTYPALGYEVLLLPKTGVKERADFVLETLMGHQEDE
ncbi:AAA family ATPase [Klebsiella sp. BIGb0407]|uniref:AAA family ATPase n=1 Tax=Klebsiella sp. BIGb0407 TaxID=2940603 RepID=UPI0021677C74|nr:AAA family ATPase [Klebsiella sp. BIGb0407]MCS3432313.1 putative ATPase [Klebsiella sp. BIGb0407]